jgi:lipopolysaccharide/colanic/teichoic acid biosynthesis glycosyltransferase
MKSSLELPRRIVIVGINYRPKPNGPLSGGTTLLKGFRDISRQNAHYIDQWSISTDIAILLKTFKVVVEGKGSW